MKKKLIFLILAMSLPMCAQTTYTQQGTTGAGPLNPNRYPQLGPLQYDNGFELQQLYAVNNYACPNQTTPHPGLGWVFYTLNGVDSPCLPVTYFTRIGPIQYLAGNKCPTPSGMHVEFTGGVYDAQLKPILGGYRQSYCYVEVVSATVTLP